jgi:hypothetical protein
MVLTIPLLEDSNVSASILALKKRSTENNRLPTKIRIIGAFKSDITDTPTPLNGLVPIFPKMLSISSLYFSFLLRL